MVRLQTWRLVREGEYERWADFSFSIDAARPPEDVQLAAPDDPSLVARGLRHRLLVGSPLQADALLATSFARPLLKGSLVSCDASACLGQWATSEPCSTQIHALHTVALSMGMTAVEACLIGPCTGVHSPWYSLCTLLFSDTRASTTLDACSPWRPRATRGRCRRAAARRCGTPGARRARCWRCRMRPRATRARPSCRLCSG